MEHTKKRTLDTIQLNKTKTIFPSYPKPRKHFVCLYGKINLNVRYLHVPGVPKKCTQFRTIIKCMLFHAGTPLISQKRR